MYNCMVIIHKHDFFRGLTLMFHLSVFHIIDAFQQSSYYGLISQHSFVTTARFV